MGIIELGTLYLEELSYLAIFSFIVLNGTGFFPFPEELTLIISGYLYSQNIVKLKFLLPIAIVGMLLGDSIFYLVGRMHPYALKRYGKYIFLSKPVIDKVHKFFDEHGKKTVFLTRFIMGMRIPTGFIAGSRGMSYWTYSWLNLAGAVIWSTALISVGYIFGAYIDLVVEDVMKARHATFVLFIALIGAWLAYHYFKHLLNPNRSRF